MRLKTTPDDFRVRELLEWNEVPNGNFIVHKLHKEKLSTPEALADCLTAEELLMDYPNLTPL